MPTVALTDRSVRSLKRPEQGRIDYMDKSVPGFGMRVSASGVRVYFVRYRRRNDRKPRRFTIGKINAPKMTLGNARGQARDILAKVRDGQDPSALRDVTAHPVGTLADLGLRYITARSPNLARSTEGEYRRTIQAYLQPARGGPARAAAELVAGDVEELLERVARKHGAVMANRVFSFTRAVCRWATRKGFVARDRDPTWGVSQPRRTVTRDRVLQDHEVKILWEVTEPGSLPDLVTPVRKICRPTPASHAAAVRLQLLLGTRPTELLLMRWADLDLAAGTWTIPADDRKGKESAHVVPLSPTAKRILEGLREFTGSHDRVLHGTHPESWLRFFKPIRALALAAGAAHFTRHDLRRTCATGCARLGASEEIVRRILGHKRTPGAGNIAGIYNRYDRLQEIAAALNAWAAFVEQLAARKEGDDTRVADVVPIRR